MDAAKVARATWDGACTLGTEPKVFELVTDDSGQVRVLRTHCPVSEAFVVSTVQDMVCRPGVEAIAVWTATSRHRGAQMLLVVGDPETVPVVLVGRVGDEPQVLEAMVGRLYAACLAALTPVPADDPLVLELAWASSMVDYQDDCDRDRQWREEYGDG